MTTIEIVIGSVGVVLFLAVCIFIVIDSRRWWRELYALQKRIDRLEEK